MAIFSYRPVITDIGLQKISEAIANDTDIILDTIALGDASSDLDYDPISSMTELKNEVTRIRARTVTIATNIKSPSVSYTPHSLTVISVELSGVNIPSTLNTKDAFVIENGSVTITPNVMLNDYVLDDRNLDIGDINLFTQKSVDIVTENIITDEDIGYSERELPLGDNSIKETRSISTIIKVENRDDN